MAPDPTLISITRSVNDLAVTTQALSDGNVKQIARQRRITRWLAFISALKALVIIGLAVLVVRLQRLADLAAENSARIAEVQARTSVEVLCPLWELFLKSYNPNSTAARESKLNYDESFRVIEIGAERLGCAVTKRGK